MNSVQVDQAAPDFALPAHTGEQIRLSEFRGKNVVLYFYPKDDTPGCTTEACGFRDGIKQIAKTDTVILGVSPDDVASHQKFIQKYSLPFLLLSDMESKICELYGVWVEKNMYGRKYMGVARTTFIINKQGEIVKIFEKVKPEEHLEEVVEILKSKVCIAE